MVHPHGDHLCYCPSCEYEQWVPEYVKCNTLVCCMCGDRMRAKDTGEFRSLPSTGTAIGELTGTTVAGLESALNQMEESLDYGEKAKLQIISSGAPTRQELNQIHNDLVSAGFHISGPRTRTVQGLPMTELVITKGSPQWAALLIPIIPTVLIVGLIAFGLVRIEAITKAIMPLLLVGGGIAIAIVAAVAASPRAAGVAEKAVTRR